jgi:ABC-type multidrug transport system permease subunit
MNKLPLIPNDKANHFIYGFIIFILSTLVFSNLISLFIVSAFAGSKELYDKASGKGNPEFLDFLATVLPGLILTILSII